MKRFLRFMFVCYGALLILIGGMEILGHLSPISKAIPELDKCDNTPCYLSITPGKTKFAEAQNIIRDNPQFNFEQTFDGASYKQAEPFNRVQLFGDPSDFVAVIQLDQFSKGFNVGELLLQLGQPCEISTRYPGIIDLMYLDKTLTFSTNDQIDDKFLGPALPLEELTLQHDNVGSCEQSYFVYPDQTWHGFGHYK